MPFTQNWMRIKECNNIRFVSTLNYGVKFHIFAQKSLVNEDIGRVG